MTPERDNSYKLANFVELGGTIFFGDAVMESARTT
jgi:hypothetical protein